MSEIHEICGRIGCIKPEAETTLYPCKDDGCWLTRIVSAHNPSQDDREVAHEIMCCAGRCELPGTCDASQMGFRFDQERIDAIAAALTHARRAEAERVREVCAKVAELPPITDTILDGDACDYIAAAIRATGEV